MQGFKSFENRKVKSRLSRVNSAKRSSLFITHSLDFTKVKPWVSRLSYRLGSLDSLLFTFSSELKWVSEMQADLSRLTLLLSLYKWSQAEWVDWKLTHFTWLKSIHLIHKKITLFNLKHFLFSFNAFLCFKTT